METNIWELIPTDVLVEVLLRVPPSARRRFRLVCRMWRHTVDTHTKEMRSRPKTLVATIESLYLIDDDDDDGATATTVRLWSGDTYRGRASLIGSCNGLVCLCDTTVPGGAITLANPLTGATLAIPPPPLPYVVVSTYWERTYCFAYHPMTGRYKAVHLQCDFNRAWVFTLGGASWRDVSGPGTASSSPSARANPDHGIVGVDGAVYWAVRARGARPRIMALDLADDRVTSVGTIPYLPPNTVCWNLVAVGARLGIAVIADLSPVLSETEVWVMNDGASRGRRSWSRRYTVQIHKPPPPLCWHHKQYPTWPLFSHDGEHILTMKRSRGTFSGFVIYKHKLCDIGIGVEGNNGTVLANIHTIYYNPCRTFAYVETTEPLSCFPMQPLDHKISQPNSTD